jgi:hypothetical protein
MSNQQKPDGLVVTVSDKPEVSLHNERLMDGCSDAMSCMFNTEKEICHNNPVMFMAEV